MEVLIVEDDAAVRDSLRRSLVFEGYRVRTAVDGEQALAEIAASRPDAVILDLQLPRLDGLEACRRLRARGDVVPVLMLTARDGTRDRVTGLDAGADDYLPKPFALEELLARLRALLRRSRTTSGRTTDDRRLTGARTTVGTADATAGATTPPEAPAEAGLTVATDDLDEPGELLDVAGLRMNLATREVTRGDREIELTRTEFALLELFLRNPRRVLPRQRILARVWGYDFDPGSNTLDVYVGYLRRKTEAGGEPRLLHNVRGVGYVLRLPKADRGDGDG